MLINWKTKENYDEFSVSWKTSFSKIFLKSIKPTKEFGTIFFYESLFYVIVIPLTFAYATLVNTLYKKMPDAQVIAQVYQEVKANSITSMTEEQAKQLLFDFQVLYYSLIIGAILIVTTYFLAWCFSQGLIFSRLAAKKDLSWKFFKKFVLLNLLVVFIAAVIFFGATFLQAFIPWAKYLMAIILLLLLHSIFLVYYFFTKSPELNAIQKAFVYWKEHWKKFLLPWALAIVLFAIITGINFAVMKYIADINIVQVTSMILTAWFLAWMTTYYVLLVNK